MASLLLTSNTAAVLQTFTKCRKVYQLVMVTEQLVVSLINITKRLSLEFMTYVTVWDPLAKWLVSQVTGRVPVLHAIAQ